MTRTVQQLFDLTGQVALVTGASRGIGAAIAHELVVRGLTVIGTASRSETADWVRQLGAHHVIDHSKPLHEEIARLGLPPVTYVASLNQSEQHWPAIAELIAPQGKVALIDDPAALDIR